MGCFCPRHSPGGYADRFQEPRIVSCGNTGPARMLVSRAQVFRAEALRGLDSPELGAVDGRCEVFHCRGAARHCPNGVGYRKGRHNTALTAA